MVQLDESENEETLSEEEKEDQELQAFVEDWMKRTADTTEFEQVVDQIYLDTETLDGADADVVEDETAMSVQYAYRQSRQALALLVPDDTSTQWKPREQVAAHPLSPAATADPGAPLGPSQATERFAQSVKIVTERLLDDANQLAHINSYGQDNVTYSMAILKLVPQEEWETEPLTDDRSADLQPTYARYETLVEEYEDGQWGENDERFHEMELLEKELEDPVKVAIFTGFKLSNVRRENFRVDPAIRNLADVYNAKWMAHDSYIMKRDARDKFDLTDADMSGLPTYQIREGVAQEQARDEEDRQDVKHTRANTEDHQLVHVREIWDRMTGTVYWLINGLKRPAGEWKPDFPCKQFFPFVITVSNPHPRRLDGFSPTEMVRKLQDARNRKGTAEEEGHRNAQPRLVYDTNQLDSDDVRQINNIGPWEGIGLDMAGNDIRKAVMSFTTNNSINPSIYDDSKITRAMDLMSGMPSQAQGVTNNADFSSEVQLAGFAMNALTGHMQNLFSDSLERLKTMAAEYALQFVDPELAQALAGPHVVWPEEPMDRENLFRSITVEVKVSMRGEFETQKRAQNILKLLDILVGSNQAGNLEPIITAFARTVGEDALLGESFRPDMTRIIANFLEQAPQQGLENVDPKLMQQLSTMLAPMVLNQMAGESEEQADEAANRLETARRAEPQPEAS